MNRDHTNHAFTLDRAGNVTDTSDSGRDAARLRTHMEWIQVANSDSSVLTRLMVTQDKHGPFPIPKN